MCRISEHVRRHMQLNRTRTWGETSEREGERAREGEKRWYRSSLHRAQTRREMAFTCDKDSLMDDSARCFRRSSATRWYFDGLIDVDTMTSLPGVRDWAADLCDTERTDKSMLNHYLDGWYRRSLLAVQTLGRRCTAENATLPTDFPVRETIRRCRARPGLIYCYCGLEGYIAFGRWISISPLTLLWWNVLNSLVHFSDKKL